MAGRYRTESINLGEPWQGAAPWMENRPWSPSSPGGSRRDSGDTEMSAFRTGPPSLFDGEGSPRNAPPSRGSLMAPPRFGRPHAHSNADSLAPLWKYQNTSAAQSTQYLPAPPESPGLPKMEEKKPPGPPGGPPPDGGTTAWLQVLGGYFLFFNTWGIINAFGVFQTYYTSTLLSDHSNSQVAWIGTLTAFLLCASPISWGPIFDLAPKPEILVPIGSFCIVLGVMLTSICREYYQIMICQGIITGIGGGCAFLTAVSILPTYFSSKRALAMGLAASGSSLGGVVYPIVFDQLEPRIGYGWTVRIIGFIALATLAIPCAVIKVRSRAPGKRKIFDVAIFKEVPFAVFNVATFFGFVGQYIPYFFIEQYASMHDIPHGFYMLTLLSAGSIPGRILPSLLADKFFHPLLVLATCTAGATLLAFCWIAITSSFAGLVVWCLLYGFCSGAFVSLQGAAVASMTKDLRTIGTRFGINMFAGALGILIGSPVGGAIFPTTWPGAQAFCGVMLLCSTVAIGGTYVVYMRGEGKPLFGGKGR